MSNKTNTVSLTDVSIEDLLAELVSRATARGDVKAASKGKASKKAEAEEPESDGPTREERKAELEAMRITSVRKIVIEHGYEESEVKAEKDKAVLVDTVLDEEFGEGSDDDEPEDADDSDEEEEEDGDEEDEDDDEEGDDEDGEWTREDLEALSLKDLKALAKSSEDEGGWGLTTADLKGLDQDAIVDLLLDEEGGDDEDDEDEDEEDEEDDDDESDDYSEDDLKKMPIAELKALAKEWEVKAPRKKADEKPAAYKKRMIAALLAE